MRAHSSRTPVIFAVALAIGLAGCASAGSANRPEGASRTVIVQEEFDGLGQISPLRAIERLRPQWLRGRGDETPQLHIDGARRSSLNDLEAYQLTDIARMEYMSATDASTRFGTGYTGGVILVFTR